MLYQFYFDLGTILGTETSISKHSWILNIANESVYDSVEIINYQIGNLRIDVLVLGNNKTKYNTSPVILNVWTYLHLHLHFENVYTVTNILIVSCLKMLTQ